MLWLLAPRRAEHVSRIGDLIFLAPLLSLALISKFLGEIIVTATWIGLVLILFGVVLQQRGRAPEVAAG